MAWNSGGDVLRNISFRHKGSRNYSSLHTFLHSANFYFCTSRQQHIFKKCLICFCQKFAGFGNNMRIGRFCLCWMLGELQTFCQLSYRWFHKLCSHFSRWPATHMDKMFGIHLNGCWHPFILERKFFRKLEKIVDYHVALCIYLNTLIFDGSIYIKQVKCKWNLSVIFSIKKLDSPRFRASPSSKVWKLDWIKEPRESLKEKSLCAGGASISFFSLNLKFLLFAWY